jgi:arylsulfatase
VPTILELAGGQWPKTVDGKAVPPLPGKSLMPAFSKDRVSRHDYFWWYHDGNRAIRIGNWKLVSDHDKPWELYDMTTDRSEANNLAGKRPEKVRELSETWARHEKEFEELAWPEVRRP